MSKRICVAGTGSGAGKTTITVGLMAALKQRGLVVQGYKCGPDYIDPTFHTSVTGRESRNLDSWMLEADTVKEIYVRASKGADISIIEGVMGLYDGKDPLSNAGSTAEIADLIQSPILLVIDCSGIARTAAAIVKGFQHMQSQGSSSIVGIIANRVGSVGHYHLVRDAVEAECGIPVVGYLLKDASITMPERHLGLVPSIERGELTPFFAKLGQWIEQSVDIDKLLELAEAKELDIEPRLFLKKKEEPAYRIAVAKDAAFHFYYPENLELLEVYGAEIVYFSPLEGDKLPECIDGLYIGGGFPEEFAERLSRDSVTRDSIREAIHNGMPALAECGGFMYLTEQLIQTDGTTHDMLGIIPGKVTMHKRLAAMGYREINGQPGNYLLPEGITARGHEFHYSTYEASEEEIPKYAYHVKGWKGEFPEGRLVHNVVGGYTHIHFASEPRIVQNWLKRCSEWKINSNE